jgi:NTP pyrophosphatase (non-canonical NTP hydrolase)
MSEDYFGELVERGRAAAAKASAQFPQPNYVTLKIAEEAGEVVRGAVHYAEKRMEWSEVEGEIVQLLAMLIRFVTEGDQVNGVIPPARAALETKP